MAVDHYALDLDGVILDYIQACRESCGLPDAPEPPHFDAWGWTIEGGGEPFKNPKFHHDALTRSNANPHLYPTQYTKQVVDFLKDKPTTVVTARPALYSMKTGLYLTEQGVDIRGVVCNAMKGADKVAAMKALGITIIIDDALHNLTEARAAGFRAICAPQAWNTAWDGEVWKS